MFKICIAFVLFTITLPLFAKDANWQENRLSPLEKITVGPWDNFEATVDANDRRLFYTRDQNQIPTIYSQYLNENASDLHIGSEGDAKEPVLSQDGKQLVFTYYKNDAQGDICLADLSGKVTQCIEDKKSIDESPFWLQSNRIGYLRRTIDNIQKDLVIYDLGGKTKQVIHSGYISAPTASPDGKFILFNEVSRQAEFQIKAYNVETQKITTAPRFDLPGITGFMAFSRDGKFVYFNHYLSDTNFDQTINANDHSVAFRIPYTKWLQAKNFVLPEQLTSVENNCKFPVLSAKNLYLTCAFEGSLDIYRLPSNGSVAEAWNEKQLWEAHKAARSYEDKLLILNTIRYRFNKNDIAMLERLLTNHLEIGEFTAASYYIKQLENRYSEKQQVQLANFYQVLDRLVYIRSQKQQLAGNIITARFQRLLKKEKTKLLNKHSEQNLVVMINASIDYELNEFDSAIRQLESFRINPSNIPMMHYLVYSLYENILRERNPKGLTRLYPVLFNDKVISQDARLYYAYNYLQLVSELGFTFTERIQFLDAHLNEPIDEKVKKLFDAELLSMRLALAEDKKQRAVIYKDLNALLNENKNDLILRKVQHIRAIQILGAADQLQYMELLSRSWLIMTQISEIEFYSVAEQYSVITMDKAYGRIAESQPAKAFATFYSAIRQTNDLEAHYHFLSIGLDPSVERQKQLSDAYATLEKENLLGEQKRYVDALRQVIDFEKSEKKDAGKLNDALVLLKQLPNVGPATAMRELLMGYIYHQQMRSLAKGFSFDKSLYQKAHFHYMMAMDFGRLNTRVEATALQNLAWLHFEVRNYGLSADFFQRRISLPFVKIQDEIAVRWAYARSLFYNYKNELAYQQALINLEKLSKTQGLDEKPFVEKAAFYAVQAKRWEDAIKHYNTLFKSKEQLTQANYQKARLSNSYALYKSGKLDMAIQGFEEVLSSAKDLDSQSAQDLRLVSFEPERLELLALGFLAKAYSDPLSKVKVLENRIAILEGIKKRVEAFTLDEPKRLSLIIKDYNHMAIAYEAAARYPELHDTANKAMDKVLLLAEETGDDLAPVVYRGITNYLSLAITNAEIQTFSHKNIKSLYDRMMTAFNKIPYRTDFDIYQQTKLQILWLAYSKDTGDIASLMNSANVKAVKQNNAEVYAELDQLAQYFTK